MYPLNGKDVKYNNLFEILFKFKYLTSKTMRTKICVISLLFYSFQTFILLNSYFIAKNEKINALFFSVKVMKAI